MPPHHHLPLRAQDGRLVKELERAGYTSGLAREMVQVFTTAKVLGIELEYARDNTGDWFVQAISPDDEVISSPVYLKEPPNADRSDPAQWQAEENVLRDAIDYVKDAPGRNPPRRDAWRKRG